MRVETKENVYWSKNVWYIVPSLVLLVIAGWLVMKYVWGNDFSVYDALILKSALFGIQYALKLHDFSASTFYFFLDVSLLIVHLH